MDVNLRGNQIHARRSSTRLGPNRRLGTKCLKNASKTSWFHVRFAKLKLVEHKTRKSKARNPQWMMLRKMEVAQKRNQGSREERRNRRRECF